MRFLLAFLLLSQVLSTPAQDVVIDNAVVTIAQGTKISVPGNLINNGTITNNGDISLGGQWQNNDTYNAGTGSLTLTSNADQIVNHNAQSFSRLRVTGGGNKIFEADLTIENELILEEGILQSGNNASLHIASSASLTGQSELSFIQGRVVHSGTGSKVFPVGFDGLYLPITLQSLSGSATEIGIQVYEPNALAATDQTLLEVSDQRYWDVELLSGTLDEVTYVPDLVNENLAPINELVVAIAPDRTQFTSIGQSGFTGDATLGTLSSLSTNLTGYLTIGVSGNGETPVGSISVFNAVSPNGDGLHEFLEIENIVRFPDNRVLIYDRWGTKVYSASGYDNASIRFEGVGNVGNAKELPNGTYFYLIDKGDGSQQQSGSLLLKR